MNNDKAKTILDSILESFKNGNIVNTVKKTVIRKKLNIPSAKWSFLNCLIVEHNCTVDPRGYRQWEEVNRHPMKGSRAFFIFAPVFRKVKPKTTENNIIEENENKEFVLKGFGFIPVFRYEDTEGEPLPPDQHAEPENFPPLFNIAEKIGLSVSYGRFFGECRGYYVDSLKSIVLATYDQDTFFHELAHAAHYKVMGKDIENRNKNQKEIVAELCSAVISEMYGFKKEKTSFDYITNYVKENGSKKDVYDACMSVIAEVGKVLDFIFDTQKQLQSI